MAKVLIVDEDPLALEKLRRHLRGKLELYTATSREEGLVKLAIDPEIQVFATDSRFAGNAGLDLVRQVRDEYPDVTRILLGQAPSDLRPDDVFTVIPKPFPAAYLQATFRAAIAQRFAAHAAADLMQSIHAADLLRSLDLTEDLVHPDIIVHSVLGAPASAGARCE